MSQITAYKILIATSDEELNSELEKLLKIYDLTAISKHDHDEAFKYVETEKVEIVILDSNMKESIDLLDDIKKRDTNNPKVFFIKNTDDVAGIFAAGADGLLSKPFDSRTVINTIRKAHLTSSQIWQVPPHINIDREILDLEGAVQWGRGGFMMSGTTNLPQKDEYIAFRFDSGLKEVGPMDGVGVVRWIEEDKAAGIEIIYLADDCREKFVSWVNSQDPQAFIPK